MVNCVVNDNCMGKLEMRGVLRKRETPARSGQEPMQLQLSCCADPEALTSGPLRLRASCNRHACSGLEQTPVGQQRTNSAGASENSDVALIW